MATEEQTDAAPDASMIAQIQSEIADLKTTAQSFSPSNIRDGSWFNKFIKSMLGTYSTRIIEQGGVDFFREKYPGLTQDQIAEKLSSLAVRYAALAGGASGATASAAFAATIGTGGIGGGAAIPAAASAIVAEMLFTTRLQVRLVYDLSVLYGYPINVDDPEDLYKAFSLAYGISMVSGNAGGAVKAVTPELARTYVRSLVHGHTQAIQQIAIRLLGPRLGRQITEKAILRSAVPVIGIGLSSGWNYLSTSNIASIAQHEIRARAKLRDSVRQLSTSLESAPAEQVGVMLEAMLALAMADGSFGQHEQEVYQQVLKVLNPSHEVLTALQERVEVDPELVAARLAGITDPAVVTPLTECLMLLAVSDGDVADPEVRVLNVYFARLGRTLDVAELHRRAVYFKRPQTRMDQVSNAASSAAGAVASLGRSALGWFGRKAEAVPTAETAPPPPAPEGEEDKALSSIMDRLQVLAKLHDQGILTDEEYQTKKAGLLKDL